MYYCILVCGAFYIKTFWRVDYHEARPFWVNTDIYAYHCKKSYGCPSGHVTVATSLAFTLAFDLTDELLKKQDVSYTLKFFALVPAYALAIIYPSCVAFSRVVQGAHAINQVLFAGTIGLWCAFTL